MKKGESVNYEWDIETFTLDEYEDIEGHNHADTLQELSYCFPLTKNERLVLVRDVGSDSEGVTDRQWAYVENQELPAQFANGSGNNDAKVPQRFHKEINAFFK